MLVRTENANRYGVYVFYDKDGIVDEYNDYFLRDLKKNLTKLLVICNGDVQPEGLKRLEEIADEVLVRENKGFDITSYKIGIEYYGYEELKKYDEVMVLNSTTYGPFYPFSEMFETMDGRDVDFWGITKFHQVPFDPFGTIKYGYIPEHIQSYFMVFRKSFTETEDFKNYWKNLPEIHSYEEAVGYHETVFTKDFADKGYKWDVYVDSSDLEHYTYDPLRDFPRQMIEERKCPIIKRRSFFHEYQEAFSRSGGEGSREALDFIEKNLDYDTGMIWKNILRLQNQADLKKRMQLNYILSSKLPLKKSAPKLTTALVLHIYYEDLAEYCYHYVNSMPQGTDIYITVPTEEKKKYVEKVFQNLKDYKLEIRVVGNIGRDVAPFLVGCKDIVDKYDLICKVHDKKVYQVMPMSIGESWAYKCFENLLKNKIFVENVITTFEENPYLGMLTPPMPHHGPYYPTCGKGEWGENFAVTQKVARELGVKVDMNPNKEPIAPLGSMFWVRTKALKGLFAHDWEYEEFPKEPIETDATVLHAIERVYPFCVQQEGYYPAWLMVDTYARIEFTNWRFINGEMHKAAMKQVGVSRHRELLEKIHELK